MSTDPIANNPELVEDRYENRRKMAWLSFYLFSGVGIVVVLVGLYNAALITAIWLQIVFLMGLWASIVGAYFGVTYGIDKIQAKK